MSDPATSPTDVAIKSGGASRLQFFGVLLAGGGLGGSLIAYPVGAGVPLLLIALGVGVILLTLDWLMRHA